MTFTHLTVGTSKLPSKPPRSNPPCTEPYVKGANILRDPGFELHLSNTGKTEIPELSSSWATLTWQDTTTPDPSLIGWANTAYVAGGSVTAWDISDAGEETGSYSARMVGNTLAPHLAVIGLVGCSDGEFYSARCEPGDYTRVACRGIVDSTSGTPNVLIAMEWYAADGSFIDSADLADTPLTTSYATYETDGFAPATSYYMRVYYKVSNQSGRTIYLDNAVLEVS